MGLCAGDAPSHLYSAELTARKACASYYYLVDGVPVHKVPPEVEGCFAHLLLLSLQAPRYKAPILTLLNIEGYREASWYRRRGGVRGVKRKSCAEIVLHLQVGPEGPHRHLQAVLMAVYLPPPPLLSVQIVYLRLVGVRRQVGADSPRQEYHYLYLLGVGLEPHTAEERTEGVEGPPKEGWSRVTMSLLSA